MYRLLVQKFLSKESNVAKYRQALALLRECGALEIIRRGGYPSVINNGSDLNAMAHEGSWANGFQTGINQLEYLEEYYANKADPQQARLTPTFGASEIARKEGYLSIEEITKLNKGKK